MGDRTHVSVMGNSIAIEPFVIAVEDGVLADLRDGDDVPSAGGPEFRRQPLETTVPGIFAAGDVRHGSVKRVAAAVGEGASAIQQLHRYLESVSGSSREVAS